MRIMLITTDGLVVAKSALSQGLFSGLCSASKEGNKKEESSKARTGDLNWSKGHSTK